MPTQPIIRFWKRLEEGVAPRPLLEVERRFVRQRGREQEVELELERGGDGSKTARYAVADVLALRRTDFAPRLKGEVRKARVGVMPPDGRWQLLADLIATLERSMRFEAEPWRPIHFDVAPAWDDRYFSMRRIQITFDPQLSLKELTRQLKIIWPDLRAGGLRRATRTLADRSLALIRFVALEAPLQVSWDERHRQWNQAHPDWRFLTTKDLQNQFHRSEKSLTGIDHGLAPLYDEKAWVEMVGLAFLGEQQRRLDEEGQEIDADDFGVLGAIAHRVFSEVDFVDRLQAARTGEVSPRPKLDPRLDWLTDEREAER